MAADPVNEAELFEVERGIVKVYRTNRPAEFDIYGYPRFGYYIGNPVGRPQARMRPLDSRLLVEHLASGTLREYIETEAAIFLLTR